MENVWHKIMAKVSAQNARLGAIMPYVPVQGKHTDKFLDNPYWWCNGFWAGQLWLAYKSTGDAAYADTAGKIEERLDAALAGFEGLHHDVGFMWTLTARLNYALTGNGASRIRALHAASLFAGRYNPRGRFIRSWNGDKTGWVIVDCMMNLPLLYWASRETADPRFAYIAMDHADTALRALIRDDGTANHIAVLDPAAGALLDTPAGQGYAPGSSWSRGQAWALYGFALSAAHASALDPAAGERYLAASKRIAHYFIAQAAVSGYVTVVDFRAPASPVKLDTSAGAIAACGLLQLADLVADTEKAFYRDAAEKLLAALIDGHCDFNPAADGIVQNGTAQYHGKLEEFHVPLIYGDYFFMEAVGKITGNAAIAVW